MREEEYIKEISGFLSFLPCCPSLFCIQDSGLSESSSGDNSLTLSSLTTEKQAWLPRL